jgi:hypothetical protein
MPARSCEWGIIFKAFFSANSSGRSLSRRSSNLTTRIDHFQCDVFVKKLQSSFEVDVIMPLATL